MASLRDEMPGVAALIDEHRAIFGDTPERLAAINAAIKAGMQGQPTFWASENGRTVGTKDTRPGVTPTTFPKTAPAPAWQAGKVKR